MRGSLGTPPLAELRPLAVVRNLRIDVIAIAKTSARQRRSKLFRVARRVLTSDPVRSSLSFALVAVLLALAATAGCGGRSPLDMGIEGLDAGEGHDGASEVVVNCSDLDESHCAASPGCAASVCPSCYGKTNFSCYRAGDTPPLCVIPPCAPLEPCSILKEDACNARTDCQAGYCSGCMRRAFVGCGDPGTGFLCPAGCPVAGPCATETTLAGCESRIDCHAVLADQGTCDCPTKPTLDHCADGAKAACQGAPTCHRVAPYCETPDFVVSYANGCYEGCVRAKDCAP